jgi:hypothetical protein
MCNLCSKDPDVVLREQRKMLEQVNDLRRLANKLELMAGGHIRPHTFEAKRITMIARNVIRYLVDEWM